MDALQLKKPSRDKNKAEQLSSSGVSPMPQSEEAIIRALENHIRKVMSDHPTLFHTFRYDIGRDHQIIKSGLVTLDKPRVSPSL
jgi:hypothetical protein